MSTGLFSTYRQGENRVTATLLAVLQRLSLVNTDRILQALLDDSTFQLVHFDNQIVHKQSVPDARISAKTSIYIETKTDRNTVDPGQVRAHLGALEIGERLLLLTPDDQPPPILADVGDDRLAWANFRALSDAIKTFLQDENDPPTEREAFLLREFIVMLESDGLVWSPEDIVLVVAARRAWPEYEVLRAYICQPNRTFRPAAHIAFYAEGRIQRLIPRIKYTLESVKIETNLAEGVAPEVQELAKDLMVRIAKHREGRIGGTSKVLFLTSPGETGAMGTITLETEVVNDLGAAFTQGQRYVFLEALKSSPKTTTDLLERNRKFGPGLS